jgi:molybdenum cofactor cytidylyltransferase
LSRRFGRQKLLELLAGEVLVRSSARRLLDAGLDPVIVVASRDPRFDAALDGLPLRVLENPQPELGISQSIRLGIGALADDSAAVLIAVADQPYLTAAALRDLVGAYAPGRIVVPRFGEHRGNPPIFDRRFFPELLRLEGDRGGQVVVNAHPEAVVEVSLAAAMGVDIDQPGDWSG